MSKGMWNPQLEKTLVALRDQEGKSWTEIGEYFNVAKERCQSHYTRIKNRFSFGRYAHTIAHLKKEAKKCTVTGVRSA